MLKSLLFGASLCVVDLLLYFVFVSIYGWLAKDFRIADCLIFSSRFLLWRILYLQIPIQWMLISMSHYFGLHQNGAVVIVCVIGAFVFSVFAFSGDLIAAFRSLVPHFSIEYFNEGFLMVVTALLAWFAVRLVLPLFSAQ